MIRHHFRGPWEVIIFFLLLTWKFIWFDDQTGVNFYVMDSWSFWKQAFMLSWQGDWTGWDNGIDLISLSLIVLLTGWCILLRRWTRIWVMLTVNVIFTLMILSDLIYFRYFNDFVTIPVLLQSAQLSELGGSIATLFHWGDLFVIADAPVWALWIWWCHSRRGQDSPVEEGSGVAWTSFSTKRSLYLTLAAMYLFAISGVTATIANGIHNNILERNWWSISMYNTIGLLGFHLYDTGAYARDHLRPVPVWAAEEKEAAWRRFDQLEQLRAKPNKMTGIAKHANVIVLQVEALQSFIIGASVEDREITPNLNRLLKQSLYVPDYKHQTAQGRTADADFISHCSLYPLTSGAVFMRAYESRFDCLPALLKRHGYATQSFHAFQASFWNRKRMYPNIGFDHFMSAEQYTIDEKAGWGLGDRSFLRQSMNAIESMKQPFYSFLITLSSHHPYRLQDEFRTFPEGRYTGTMMGDYIQAIHYTDQAIGEFINRMKANGLWENTILIIYGDHDNSMPAGKDVEALIGKPLNNASMRAHMRDIPLIVHFPGNRLAGIYPQPAGQLDFAPSIADWLGIPSRNMAWLGIPLHANTKDRSVAFRSGEVLNKHVLFQPALDRIPENGNCLDRINGTKILLENCLTFVRQKEKEMLLSDEIILHNRLSERAQNQKPY